MTTQIVLLRGINIGPNHRVAMPALREALRTAGFTNVRTYIASGNIVLDSEHSEEELTAQIGELLAEQFTVVPVVSRTRDELAEVVARNPLADVDCSPKLYQVSFLDRAADPERVEQMMEFAVGDERVVASGREWFAVFPDGIARSKLAAKMAAKNSGVIATARNWTTVTKLLEMAEA